MPERKKRGGEGESRKRESIGKGKIEVTTLCFQELWHSIKNMCVSGWSYDKNPSKRRLRGGKLRTEEERSVRTQLD